MAKAVCGKFGKVPEPKSYEQVSLKSSWPFHGWGSSEVPQSMCVGGGGYVAGKIKRSGDWGEEEHIRVQLNIERQQFSQPTKEIANARPWGLRIWYTAFFSSTVFGLCSGTTIKMRILQLPSAKRNNTIHKYLLLLYSGKNSSSDVSRQGGCRKNWTTRPEKAPFKSLPEKLQTRPTASKHVKPRYMTPYNLNKIGLKTRIT